MLNPELDLLVRLIESGQHFFTYRLPGGRLQQLDYRAVDFTPWPGTATGMPIPRQSTDRAVYLQRVEELISELRHDGGKAVISKVICGHSPVSPAEVSLGFFAAHPEAYCTIYNTPATGLWLGASPELLFSISGGQLHTMALAGTRPADIQQPWDSKNLEEHRMVADFIGQTLDDLGAGYERDAISTLRYGDICHLLTRFRADAAGPDIARLKTLLHPTPAVCGFPRGKAIEQIARIESHPRNMYAGTIDFTDPATATRYCIVNLRCMQWQQDSYCIYAGGGITGRSVAADEWLETEAKAAWLRRHLQA